jgi:catechol 2,3-dioxygenase-like lactoylglutathione lyase family enzyme
MKRFHVHVSVDDLEANVRFYSTVFGRRMRNYIGAYRCLSTSRSKNSAISLSRRN